MNGKMFLVSVGLLLLLAGGAAGDVVTIYPCDDTYVDSNLPDDNFGPEGSMLVGQGAIREGIRRAYVKFDLSSIPAGLVVTSARLRLNCTRVRVTYPEVGAYYLENNLWDEDAITWNNAPTGFNSGATDSNIVGFGDNFWAVTEDVHHAYTEDGFYSVVLKLTDETSIVDGMFSTRQDPNPNLWPYIEVETEIPILIATAEDLNDIAKDPNTWDRHFILVDNIDLADYTGTQFNIIGRYYGYSDPNNKPFTGVFDGSGHTICNFSYQISDANTIGLFAYVSGGAEIKNLGLVNANVEVIDTVPDVSYYDKCNCAGSLVGMLGGAAVTGCWVEDANVSGVWFVGGLVGYSEGGVGVSNSYAAGQVCGEAYVGGLVGLNGGWISNCYAAGQVSGEAYIGGLVGHNMGIIADSRARGSIRGRFYIGGLAGSDTGHIVNSGAEAAVVGEVGVGGLIGDRLLPSSPLSNCYATGDVLGEDSVGGLVGYNSGVVFWNYDYIINCYATGSVCGDDSVGGLVGHNGWDGEITSSYSVGCVWGDSNVGGLIGENEDGVVTGSFWDVDTSGQTSSEGGTGKSTAEMQTKSTFTNAGWDFVQTWDICEGRNYPRLIWEIAAADFVSPDGVNGKDFAFFARHWRHTNCRDCNNCEGTDIDLSGTVDWADFKMFADQWLQSIP